MDTFTKMLVIVLVCMFVAPLLLFFVGSDADEISIEANGVMDTEQDPSQEQTSTEELNEYDLDTKSDSGGGDIPDGVEIEQGSDPLAQGKQDVVEIPKLDPSEDEDGDGYLNQLEIDMGTDPLEEKSTPFLQVDSSKFWVHLNGKTNGDGLVAVLSFVELDTKRFNDEIAHYQELEKLCGEEAESIEGDCDNDGVKNNYDNCKYTYNPQQTPAKNNYRYGEVCYIEPIRGEENLAFIDYVDTQVSNLDFANVEFLTWSNSYPVVVVTITYSDGLTSPEKFETMYEVSSLFSEMWYTNNTQFLGKVTELPVID